jgi:sirohydrochlorin ferrochelatase
MNGRTTQPGDAPRALLFVGHGTRSEAGTQMFLDTVRRAVARLPQDMSGAVADVAYLELRDPAVPAALIRLYQRGIRRVSLVPVFLFAAGHWKHDIPAEVGKVIRQYPDLNVSVGPVLGEDQRLVALAAARCRSSAGPLGHDDALLVVGRGNRDEEALAAFHQVARRIRNAYGAAVYEAAVLYGIGTSLESAVTRLARRGPKRLVVLPYLLFDGYLTRTLPDRVRAVLQGCVGPPQMIVTDPLGPDDAVAEVLAERACTAWCNQPVTLRRDESGDTAEHWYGRWPE